MDSLWHVTGDRGGGAAATRAEDRAEGEGRDDRGAARGHSSGCAGGGGAGTAGAGIGLVDLQDTGTPTGYFFKVAGYLKKLECCKGPECNTSAKAIYQAKANLEDIVCVCCAACASPGLTSFKCTYVYHRLMGFWHLGHVIRLFYLPR